jgi:hypothetical protein
MAEQIALSGRPAATASRDHGWGLFELLPAAGAGAAGLISFNEAGLFAQPGGIAAVLPLALLVTASAVGARQVRAWASGQ